MRAVIQRVSQASVATAGKVTAEIETGLLILLGIEEADNQEDVEWLSKKISQLRIFKDQEGQMNLDIREVGGRALVVSQFTLHAKTKKGNRPSFIHAAPPDIAIPLYEEFLKQLRVYMGGPVESGEFGEDMQVSLVNDGPVTIWIDTKDKE